MKTLYLIRHAKSDWNHPQLSDFERPLNERGIQTIPIVGKTLQEQVQPISHFFTSSAARTTATAIGLSHFLNPKPSISYHKNLYLADYKELLAFINNIDNKLDHIALVIHNPGITDLCEYLSNAGISNIPTCGVVKLTFETDHWAEISGGLGKITATARI